MLAGLKLSLDDKIRFPSIGGNEKDEPEEIPRLPSRVDNEQPTPIYYKVPNNSKDSDKNLSDNSPNTANTKDNANNNKVSNPNDNKLSNSNDHGSDILKDNKSKSSNDFSLNDNKDSNLLKFVDKDKKKTNDSLSLNDKSKDKDSSKNSTDTTPSIFKDKNKSAKKENLAEQENDKIKDKKKISNDLDNLPKKLKNSYDAKDFKLQPKDYPQSKAIQYENLEVYVRFLSDYDRWRDTRKKSIDKERLNKVNKNEEKSDPEKIRNEKTKKVLDAKNLVEIQPKKEVLRAQDNDNKSKITEDKSADKKKGDKDKKVDIDDLSKLRKKIDESLDKIDNFADKDLNKVTKEAIKNEIQDIRDKYDKDKEKLFKKSSKTDQEKLKKGKEINSAGVKKAIKSDDQELLLAPKYADKSENRDKSEKQPKERQKSVIDAKDLQYLGSNKSFGKEKLQQIKDRAFNQQKIKDRAKISKQDSKQEKINAKDIDNLTLHKDDRVKVPRPLTKEERARDNFRKFKEQHRKDFHDFSKALQNHLDSINKIINDNRIKHKLAKIQNETKDIRKLFTRDGKRINRDSKKIRDENDRRKKQREDILKESLGEGKPQKFRKLNPLSDNKDLQKAVGSRQQQLILEPNYYEYSHALKEKEVLRDNREKKAEDKKAKEKEKEAQKETKEQKEKKDMDQLRKVIAEEPRKDAEKIKKDLEKADSVDERRLREMFEKETGKRAVWNKKETKQYSEYKKQFLNEREKKKEQEKENWLKEADKSEYWIANQYNANGEIIYFTGMYFPKEHEKVLDKSNVNHIRKHDSDHEDKNEKWDYSWNDFLLSYYGLKSPVKEKKKDFFNKSTINNSYELELSFSEKRAMFNVLNKFEVGRQIYSRTRELAKEIKNRGISGNIEALEKKKEEFDALYNRLMVINERYSSQFKLLHNIGRLRENKGDNKYEILPKLFREKIKQDRLNKKVERYMLNNLILREVLLNPKKYNQKPLEKAFKKETGKQAIWNKKETKAFQEWKKVLSDDLTKKRQEKNNEEIRVPVSDWAKTLKDFMAKMSEEEISKELKSELSSIVNIYNDLFYVLRNKKLSMYEKSKLALEELKKLNPDFYALFEDLKDFFDMFLLRNLDNSLVSDSAKDALKSLMKRLENMKKGIKSKEDLDYKQFDDQNFIDLIKNQIHAMDSLNIADKIKLFDIIGKKKLTNNDKKLILFLLSKICSRDLNILFGNAVRGNEIIKLVESFANNHLGKYKAEYQLKLLREREELAVQLLSLLTQSMDKNKSETGDKGELKKLEAFLKDIQDGMKKKVFEKKYNISDPTVNIRIKEILGVNNYIEAKKFLKGRKIEEILKQKYPEIIKKRKEKKEKRGRNSITHKDCIEAGKTSDKEIEFAMTQKEFDASMENRDETGPNQLKLFWKCKKCGIIFPASYSSVKSAGSGCPECAKKKKYKSITREDCVEAGKTSDKDIKFAMTIKEFDDAMNNRGRTHPRKVHLLWKCKKCRLIFPASYDGVKYKGSGCPICPGYNSITREDCVEVGKTSDKDIKFAMTQKEFDDKMRSKGKLNPSKVKLLWKCKKCGLIFPASYNNVKRCRGCPDCFGKLPITREDCVEVGKTSDKDIEIAMTQKEFDTSMENRGETIPSQIKLLWKCKKCGIIFPGSYNSIKNGSGCPHCVPSLEGIDSGIFLINKKLILSPFLTNNLKIFQRRLIRASKSKGKFPLSIKIYETNHPADYYRCSRFNKKTTYGSQRLFSKLKLRQINELISTKRIVPIDLVSKYPPEFAPIQELIKAINYNKRKMFLISSKKWVSHFGVCKICNRNEFKDYFLVSEFPIFRKKGKKLLTGHIDIVFLVQGDKPTLYIMDYKPVYSKDTKKLEERIKKVFFDSIPQVVAYIKVLRSAYGLDDFNIKGVTFNNKKAWIYEEKVLENIEDFMMLVGLLKNMVWKDYI